MADNTHKDTFYPVEQWQSKQVYNTSNTSK